MSSISSLLSSIESEQTSFIIRNWYHLLRCFTRIIPLFLLISFTTQQTFAHHPTSLSFSSITTHSNRQRLPQPPTRGPDIQLGLVYLTRHLSTTQGLQVAPGSSIHATLRTASTCTTLQPCAALIETWYDHSLYRESKPDPLLLAARDTIPDPRPSRPAGLADAEAFLTWRPYQYLIITNITYDDDWRIRVLNHNGTVINTLNTSLRVSLYSVSQQLPCPRGPDARICSAHGHCNNGKCICDVNYGGRYCENYAPLISKEPFEVESERMKYFRYIVPHSGSVSVTLDVYAASTSLSLGAQPILFVKRLGENGGTLLKEGPPLPTTYDLWFADKTAFHARLRTHKVVRARLQKGEILYIGVYNYHRQPPLWIIRRKPNLRTTGLLIPHSPVRVRLSAFPCLDRRFGSLRGKKDNFGNLRLCPIGGAQDSLRLSVTIILLPFLLGILTLLTMFVCMSVWANMFRQHIIDILHGHTIDESTLASRRDKLSKTEVNAMFPAFLFTKGETVAIGASGDVCCSVCLSTFEEGEPLRRLGCGHSYHSTCLDQWLLTNATCPRCRKSARIHGEISRTSWIRRRIRSSLSWFHGFGEFVSTLWLGDRTREIAEMESMAEGLLHRERERFIADFNVRRNEPSSWRPETL